MHLEIQLTIVTRKCQGDLSRENAIDYIAGYTLAVSSKIRATDDVTDEGSDYNGKSHCCQR